jgi:hypothetical protein
MNTESVFRFCGPDSEKIDVSASHKTKSDGKVIGRLEISLAGADDPSLVIEVSSPEAAKAIAQAAIDVAKAMGVQVANPAGAMIVGLIEAAKVTQKQCDDPTCMGCRIDRVMNAKYDSERAKGEALLAELESCREVTAGDEHKSAALEEYIEHVKSKLSELK